MASRAKSRRSKQRLRQKKWVLRPTLERLEDRSLLAVFATGSWATVDYSFTSKFSDSARAADGSNSAVESGSVSGGGQIVFTGPTSGNTSLDATGSGKGTIFFTSGPTVPYTFNVTSFGGDFEVTNGAITGSFEDHGIFMTEARTGSYSLSGSLTAGSSVSFVSNPYPINLFFGGTQTDGTIFSGSTTGGKATNNNTTPTNIAAEVPPDLPPTSFEFIVSNSGTQMDAANPNAPVSHVKLYWSSSEDVTGELGEIPLQGDPGIYWNTDSVTISSEFDDLPTGPKGAKYIVVVADGDETLGSKVTVNTAAVKIPFQWTGKGSDALWSNGDNWLAHTAPGTGDDLVFPADALQQTNENDLPDTFKSITVGSAASEFVTAAATFQAMAAGDAAYVFNGLISASDFTVESGSATLENSATVDSANIKTDTTLTVGTAGKLKMTNGELFLNTKSNFRLLGTFDASSINAETESSFVVNTGGKFNLGNLLSCKGDLTVESGGQWNAASAASFSGESQCKAHLAGTQNFANGSNFTVNADAQVDVTANGTLTSNKMTVNSGGSYNLGINASWTTNGGDSKIYGNATINGHANFIESRFEVGAQANVDGSGNVLFNASVVNDRGTISGLFEISVIFNPPQHGQNKLNSQSLGTLATSNASDGFVVESGGILDIFNSLTVGEGGNLDVFGTLTIQPEATLTNTAGFITIHPGSTFNALGTIIGAVTYAPPRVTSPASAEVISLTAATIAGVGHSGETVSLYSDPNKTSSLTGNGVTLVSSQTAAMDGGYSFTADLTLGAINHFFVIATIGDAQTGIATVPALTQYAKPWHNAEKRFDVDRDTFIVAGDVLSVINYINANGSGSLPATRPNNKASVDVTGDNSVAADDVIAIINWINANPGQSEAEDATGAAVTDSAIDDQSINPATDISPLASFADLVSLLAADAATTVTKRRSSSF